MVKKKFRQIDLFYFTSFFLPELFKIFGPHCGLLVVMYIVVLKQDLWCPQLKLEPTVTASFSTLGVYTQRAIKFKKIQTKKNLVKSNKKKFFFREIPFLAILYFFPIQKLIFGHF